MDNSVRHFADAPTLLTRGFRPSSTTRIQPPGHSRNYAPASTGSAPVFLKCGFTSPSATGFQPPAHAAPDPCERGCSIAGGFPVTLEKRLLSVNRTPSGTPLRTHVLQILPCFPPNRTRAPRFPRVKTLVVVTEFSSLMDRKCGLKTPRSAAYAATGTRCRLRVWSNRPRSRTTPPAPAALQTKQIRGYGFRGVVLIGILLRTGTRCITDQ